MKLYQFEAVYNEPEDAGVTVVVDLDAIVQFSEWPVGSFMHNLPVTTLVLCKDGAVHKQSVMASIREVSRVLEREISGTPPVPRLRTGSVPPELA